jgi:hypothetical protein
VPAGLDRDGIEDHRAGIERLLTHLSDEAEAWAVSGERRAGECIVRKEPSRVARHAARLAGPPGVSLTEELERLGLAAMSARSDERPAA